MTKMKMIHLGMAAQTGTLNLTDLSTSEQLLTDFGMERAVAVLRQQTAIYNRVLADSLNALVTVTDQRVEGNPIVTVDDMIDGDEYSNAPTSKSGDSVSRAFPLGLKQWAGGWTEHFLMEATVAKFMEMNYAVQIADTRAIRTGLAKSFYNPLEGNLVEAVTLRPYSVKGVYTDVKVKPLYNGDDEVPDVSPTGESFGAGHNHYLGSDGLSVAGVEELEQTVAEHASDLDLVIFINRADAAAFRALPGFAPNTISQVVAGSDTTRSLVDLDLSAPADDRAIGFTAGGAVVHTKPWAIKGYSVCVNLRGPRAVRMRVPQTPGLRGLRVKGLEGNTVLTAKTWEHIFGFGVSNRGAAAILNFGPKPNGAPAGVYAAPALVTAPTFE